MSSGKEHEAFIQGLEEILSSILTYYVIHSSAPPFIIFGAVAQKGYQIGWRYFSPDLDMKQRTVCAQRWERFNLRWLWRPYAKIFKHRGISHFPVLGTLSRLAYFGVSVGAPAMITAYLTGQEAELLDALQQHFWAYRQLYAVFMVGIEISALAHLYKDYR